MEFCVLFESVTGNTRLVAEKILAALPGGQARLLAITPGMAPPEEGVLFIGFWADKGTCPPATSELLGRLSGKKVALFGTAGFGGSPEYFEGIAGRARAGLPEGNGLLGCWMCQGKMPQSVRARYEQTPHGGPGNDKAAQMLENFVKALSHPDAEDLAAAEAFAREMLQKAAPVA